MSDTDYLKRIYERPIQIIDRNTAEELASLRQQLAEAKKDAERMRKALLYLKHEKTLTNRQYDVVVSAMREGK